jgi:hypothetical protein
MQENPKIIDVKEEGRLGFSAIEATFSKICSFQEVNHTTYETINFL